jgi:RNA polymerase sigma factor (sigma-70 family)
MSDMNRTKEQFTILLNSYKNIIYKIADSYSKSDIEKSDLVQEITIQLWHAFPKYDERFKFTTWLYRIALNVSISAYRKLKRKEESFQPLTDSVISTTDAGSLTEENTNLNLLQTFIHELKELDRALLILYLDNNSHKEISLILGISETNIATKISRVKTILKLKFSEQGR